MVSAELNEASTETAETAMAMLLPSVAELQQTAQCPIVSVEDAKAAFLALASMMTVASNAMATLKMIIEDQDGHVRGPHAFVPLEGRTPQAAEGRAGAIAH